MRAVFLSLILSCSACFGQDVISNNNDVRFAAIEVYLDSPQPLAAWQFELSERNGLMMIVGVENGDSAAFNRTPYYDREAVQLGTADRIIIADFTLSEEEQLPRGRIRVATIHLMLAGRSDPEYDLNLVTATTYGGQVIDASISLISPTGSEQ